MINHRYLLASLAFSPLTGLPMAAHAHVDADVQVAHYHCDAGRPFRVVYEFDHPRPEAHMHIHGRAEKLVYEDGGFSNARYTLQGKVNRANVAKTGVFLFEHTREKFNGKWQSVDLMLGKNCMPAKRP